MSNHAHILAQSKVGNISGLIRDFKRYTSKAFTEYMQYEIESRSDWMLNIFSNAASKTNRNKYYKV
jgi:hypothetical protein